MQSWAISRILYLRLEQMMVIYLGQASLQGSMPPTINHEPHWVHGKLGVAPGGVCTVRVLPHSRVVSYTTISPLAA